MTTGDGTSAAWTVTSQQQKAGQGPDGRYGPGWEIAFRTASGLNGTVFVPDAMHNVENARRLINQRIDQMTAISGLSG